MSDLDPNEACQCCGKTRSELEAIGKTGPIQSTGDPMHELEVKYDTGLRSLSAGPRDLGSLTLCWICMMGVQQTVQAPVFEERVEPLQRALGMVRQALAEAEEVLRGG
jgi:hypothetical protein